MDSYHSYRFISIYFTTLVFVPPSVHKLISIIDARWNQMPRVVSSSAWQANDTLIIRGIYMCTWSARTQPSPLTTHNLSCCTQASIVIYGRRVSAMENWLFMVWQWYIHTYVYTWNMLRKSYFIRRIFNYSNIYCIMVNFNLDNIYTSNIINMLWQIKIFFYLKLTWFVSNSFTYV